MMLIFLQINDLKLIVNIIDKDKNEKRKSKEIKFLAREILNNPEIVEATPENTGFQKTDIAQIIFKRSLLDTFEFGSSYAADGHFIQAVYDSGSNVINWHNIVLSHYNFLEIFLSQIGANRRKFSQIFFIFNFCIWIT